MSIGLIIVGDEILSGKRADKHLARVIELLSARGLSLGWARYVGDEPERLTADLADAFAGARAHGDIVFSCGGIGATPDDHTRQCAARALGVPLEMHPEARELILQRLRETAADKGETFDAGHPDNVHRLDMAMFPAGAGLVPNPYNRIAGFSVQAGEGGVYFVPGFPVMAWPMIEWVLDHPCAHRLRPPGELRQERSVIVFDGMEGALTPLMLEIESLFQGVKVFSLPSVDHPEWGRHIELGVKGSGEALAGAYRHLIAGLRHRGVRMGPELVR
jgi:molybdopterin-biosynthesis enzyme MoeA-like protein